MTQVRSLHLVDQPSRQHVHHALEQMMREALSELSSLKREVAELRSLTTAIGHRSDVAPSGHHSEQQRVVHTYRSASRTAPDFDWEAWAREKRARIRGQDLSNVEACQVE